MNQVIEVIKNRRSTRGFEQKPIPRNVIKTLIEAGDQAPCMGKLEKGGVISQPWRFVVIEDPKFKQKLVQTALPIWRNFFESLRKTDTVTYNRVMSIYESMDEPKDMVYYSAPVILFVIGSTQDPVSCALACENIILAACSLGLGSCYVGFGSMVTGNPEIVRALELKGDERIYGPILLGYPKDRPEMNVLRWERRAPVVKWI